MLKPLITSPDFRITAAATFGWLCVETRVIISADKFAQAATFGWLCVETTQDKSILDKLKGAATFGWLCVETVLNTQERDVSLQPPSGGCVLKPVNLPVTASSLAAATFGWLCVETH